MTAAPTFTALNFGALLKRYRRAAGLTQEQLAERAGYSVGHVSKLESSTRHPISATVDLLAEALTLTDTEQAALRRAAHTSVQTPSAPPRVSPRSGPPLVDRTSEVERIERHLSDSAPPLLVLAGEPGIGKSRLLDEAVERGALSGWQVLEGSCRRGNGGPYDPLLAAVAHTAARLDPAQLHVALQGCSWLVRLLPELAETGAVAMPAWALPADQERRLMFAAVERFLQNVAGPAGTLLVLDNMQWARGDTLDLLSALIHSAPQSLLKVIAGCRSHALRAHDAHDAHGALGAFVADLASERLIAVEEILRLAPADAARLFDQVLVPGSQVSEHLRAEALTKSEGMPFALVSYAHWLREGGGREQGGATHLDVPWDLAQVVQQRVTTLPPAAQVLVRIAAITDGDDALTLLGAVAQRLGYSELEVMQGLDAACEAGVLVERDGHMYGFVHNLTQEVVEQQVGTAERAHLHREIAQALAQEPGPHQADAVAMHYLEAGEPGRAVAYLERAGTRATALHAYAAAEQYYRELADQLDRGDQAWHAAHAHEQLGSVLAQRRAYDEALRELERALRGHREAGNLDGVARAAARVGALYRARGEVDQGVSRLQQELNDPRGLSTRGRAMLHIVLARLHFTAGQHARELESAERAAAFAKTAQSAHLLAEAEMERSTALDMLGHLDASLRVLEGTAIPLSGSVGDLWTQALALDRAAHDHIMRGEFERARQCVSLGVALAQQLDDSYLTAVMLHARGVLHYHTGEWHRARADLVRAGLVLRASSMPSRAARSDIWLARLEFACGRSEQARENLERGSTLAEAIGDVESLAHARCVEAEVALVAGEAAQALSLLQPLLSRSRYRETDLTAVFALLGWAQLQAGEAQQSLTLVTTSLIRAEAQGMHSVLVDAMRIRAQVDERAGRLEDALLDTSQALELARTLAYPYAEAKVHFVRGCLLARHGKSEEASEHYVAAHVLLERLGERLYAARVEHAQIEAGTTVA